MPKPEFPLGYNSAHEFQTIRVPGDGRCMFRSVVHGACLSMGKPSPNETKQKQLADELRSKVVDELINRRKEIEWYVSSGDLRFLDDDLDRYVRRMRMPHIWGGEPELLMASHVLKMPINVHMVDRKSGGLNVIAEYGQEYGKENPICVLYHSYGHYDVLKRSLDGSQSCRYSFLKGLLKR